MSDTIIVAWIAIVGITIPLVYRAIDKHLDRKLERRRVINNGTMVEKSYRALNMNRICSRLLEKSMAHRVTMNIFHNGGEFITGLKMDRFTCVAEDYVEGLTPVMPSYQGSLLSLAPYTMNRLIVNKEHHSDNVDDMSDKVLRDMLTAHGTKSIYGYLVSDVFDKPIGFITFSYGAVSLYDKGQSVDSLSALVANEMQCILKHMLVTKVK
jgi:hypothetical protein